VNAETFSRRLLQCSNATLTAAQGSGKDWIIIALRYFKPHRASTTLAVASNCAAPDSNSFLRLKSERTVFGGPRTMALVAHAMIDGLIARRRAKRVNHF
jgi:hypothetical protein